MIKQNLLNVQNNMKIACEKAGRKKEEVTLIAVSKTKPISMIQEVYDTGIFDFGENKVQEVTEKYEKMPHDINRHMIGHLQRNKVKDIVDKACLIHSIDSLRLAEEVNKQAEKKNLIANILIEVNIAKEDSKFGIMKEEIYLLLEKISKMPFVKVNGLMTIAPFTQNPEENRKYFWEIKELSVDIANKNIDNIDMNVLSMGMSNDYMIAIEEGATLIRVGTNIFGERNYSIK